MAKKTKVSPEKTRFLNLIRTSDLMVRRSLVVLFNQQTLDERVEGATIERNDAGFNAFDASQGSDMARAILKGSNLSPGEYRHARFMLKKYANQLVRLASAGTKANIEE